MWKIAAETRSCCLQRRFPDCSSHLLFCVCHRLFIPFLNRLHLCLVTAPQQGVIQLNTRPAAQLVLRDPDFILSNVTDQVGEISCCPGSLFSFHGEAPEETKLDRETFQALMELKWLSITHSSLVNQYGSKSLFCAVLSNWCRGACCSR